MQVRPRSSVDRAPASGAGCGGSIPLGGAMLFQWLYSSLILPLRLEGAGYTGRNLSEQVSLQVMNC